MPYRRGRYFNATESRTKQETTQIAKTQTILLSWGLSLSHPPSAFSEQRQSHTPRIDKDIIKKQ
jgi:hypothetical protein